MIDEENDTVTHTQVTEEYEITKIDNTPETITEENTGLLSKKRGPRKSLSELRTPRQKFCARWQVQFPWLRANRVDESVGYCTICRKELVCKKSHLERHQKSFKHMRLQGFENIFSINEPEDELVEAHTNGYIENDSECHDEGVLEEEGMEYTTIKVEPIVVKPHELQASRKKRPKVEGAHHSRFTSMATLERLEGEQTSICISPRPVERRHEPSRSRESERQRQSEHVRETQRLREPERLRETERLREFEHHREINDYYYIPRGPPTLPPQLPPKDSFDLFFESVSATVKALPPKLGAEVKSQVSQLIANFELRAICEKEAKDKAAAESAALSRPVANVVAVNPLKNSSGIGLTSSVTHPQHAGGQAVANYVYSYQSK